MNENYSLVEHFKKRFETVGRKLTFSATNAAEFYQWKSVLTGKLKEITGYAGMQKCDLMPTVSGVEDKGEYTQEHVVIETEPDVFMPLHVLVPRKKRDRYVPIIAAHGHCSGGKIAVAGIISNDEQKQSFADFNYDYGRVLCLEGFIVFCPDARGFGERKEPTVDQMWSAGSCQQINNMAVGLGQTVTGMWAWDLHRLIDYIETRRDCDANKLCCVGLSGGGLQTLWAAALDERIKGSVVSGYFYGYRESLLEQHNNCACNYIPHLWEYADIGDVGALIAPRPLFIETGDQDVLNGKSGLANVYSQVEIVRSAYRVLGREDMIKHSVFPGPHKWHGADVAEFLRSV